MSLVSLVNSDFCFPQLLAFSPATFQGRVYLMGDNTPLAPWFLPQTVPAGLEEMVLEHRWQQLATEVKKATEAGAVAKWTVNRLIIAQSSWDLSFNLMKLYIYNVM